MNPGRILGFLMLVAGLLATTPAWAQDALPRQGVLGLQAAADDDGRVVVRDLMPEGPGAAAGLEAGDVILSIDETPVTDWPSFGTVAGRLKAGIAVTLRVERAGEPVSVTLTPVERPRETLEGAQVIYGAAPFGDGLRIRTITTVPDESPLATRRRRPGVFILQGIPCSTIETLQNENHPYSQLVSRLNAAGFAVLRADKPGVGDSEGMPCADGGFTREVDAFTAALGGFKARRDVDPERVYAIGISMGGIQAPLVAEAHPLAGIITFGTGVQPWFEYTVNNFRERWLMQGQDPAQIDTTMRLWRRYFALMLILERTPAQIAAEDPDTVAALRPILGEDLDRFAGRHYSFHQELDNQALATAWGAFAGNVLSVHGEYDWVASQADHAVIPRLVARHGGGTGEFVILDGMDHGFTTHESLEASFENAFQGERSEAFYTLAVRWLTEQAGGVPAAPE